MMGAGFEKEESMEPKVGVSRGNAGKGRRPGSRNKRTQAVLAMAHEKGRPPLEIMLDVMHDLMGKDRRSTPQSWMSVI